jgi:hypothetical protein
MEVGQGPNWGCSAKGKKKRSLLLGNINIVKEMAEPPVATVRMLDYFLVSLLTCRAVSQFTGNICLEMCHCSNVLEP